MSDEFLIINPDLDEHNVADDFSIILDKTEAIIMGLFVGLLTGLLESSIVSMFMGRQFAFWFDTFIGNQALILIVIGVVIAYVGNVYLKDKIHLEIINNYLGE